METKTQINSPSIVSDYILDTREAKPCSTKIQDGYTEVGFLVRKYGFEYDVAKRFVGANEIETKKLVCSFIQSVEAYIDRKLQGNGRETVREPVGGRARMPYGYEYDKTLGYIKNEKEQAVIKIICNLHENGASMLKIVDILAEQKIKTKTGLDRWHEATVNSIIKRYG